MSNTITLVTTKFTNVVDGNETHGYRIYDNYGSTYNNCADNAIIDDMSLLSYVYENGCESSHTMLDFAVDDGIHINGTYYEGNEVEIQLNLS